jgi:hypothetical protein
VRCGRCADLTWEVVIAAASARHEGCAEACLRGLGERAKATGREMHYIHVSEPKPLFSAVYFWGEANEDDQDVWCEYDW